MHFQICKFMHPWDANTKTYSHPVLWDPSKTSDSSKPARSQSPRTQSKSNVTQSLQVTVLVKCFEQ